MRVDPICLPCTAHSAMTNHRYFAAYKSRTVKTPIFNKLQIVEAFPNQSMTRNGMWSNSQETFDNISESRSGSRSCQPKPQNKLQWTGKTSRPDKVEQVFQTRSDILKLQCYYVEKHNNSIFRQGPENRRTFCGQLDQNSVPWREHNSL